MLKFRVLMRREIVELNNQDAMSPKERLFYGTKWALDNTEGAIYRKERESEKEFIERRNNEEQLTIFILRAMNDYFYKQTTIKKIAEDIKNRATNGKYKKVRVRTIVVLVDKKFENILHNVIRKKEFTGYKITIGYTDSIAIKCLKNLRIPLIITRED